MKIVAGLGCIDDYPLFCEAGADEFFCGYVPYTWTKRYGTTLALNRREVLCYQVQLALTVNWRFWLACVRYINVRYI